MKKILSIDSGGIRGIIPALILADIEVRAGRPICNLFDFFAGTSTGGMLALGLNRPEAPGCRSPLRSANEIAGLFREWGPRIFGAKTLNPSPMRSESKPAEDIEETFHRYFGTILLSETIKPTLVTAFDVKAGQPFFLSSAQVERNCGGNIFMWQAARATTAIPSHFEPINLTVSCSPFGYSRQVTLIDGSLFASNPAMCAFAEARASFPEEDDFLLISLGCGEVPRNLRTSNAKMRRYILDSSLSAQSECADHQLQRLLSRQRYIRIQTKLAPGMDRIDDGSKQYLLNLEEAARQTIRDNSQVLQRVVDSLVPSLELAVA